MKQNKSALDSADKIVNSMFEDVFKEFVKI